MHGYLLLIDDLAPFVSLSRRRRAAILDRAAAGDEAAADEMIDIIIGDIKDRGRSPYAPDVRAFIISAAPRALSRPPRAARTPAGRPPKARMQPPVARNA
jgi:hypothetical protein